MEIFQDGELEEEMRKRDFQANSLSAVWNLFSTSYHEAIKSLTCPVRATYSVADLGPIEFIVDPADDGKGPGPGNDKGSGDDDDDAYLQLLLSSTRSVTVGYGARREDLQLVNPRGELLECSFWHALPLSPARPPPCVVYLHGMSSSRRECVYLRHRVLAAGFSLFAFDFSGSGLSRGDRFSFGHFEKDDVRTVLDFLFATRRASAVGLWGRCLGGAAALLHLREAQAFSYKTLRVPRRELGRLHLGLDRHTGAVLCVRPSRFLPFRMTASSAENGDFVLLAIGQRFVRGLDVETCRRILLETPGDVIELAGYENVLGVHHQEPPERFVFALTLDSTYGDLERVMADMLVEVSKSAEKRNVAFPPAMMTAASKVISRSVRKSAGYHFKDVAVVDDVGDLRLPCLFVSTSKVDFIRPEHTREIYDRYGGAKTWLAFAGTHDANRPDHVVAAAVEHFESRWKARKGQDRGSRYGSGRFRHDSI